MCNRFHVCSLTAQAAPGNRSVLRDLPGGAAQVPRLCGCCETPRGVARVGRDGPRVGVGDRSDPRGPEPHSTRGAVAGDESAGGEQVCGVR